MSIAMGVLVPLNVRNLCTNILDNFKVPVKACITGKQDFRPLNKAHVDELVEKMKSNSQMLAQPPAVMVDMPFDEFREKFNEVTKNVSIGES
jgi:hypothetical protein